MPCALEALTAIKTSVVGQLFSGCKRTGEMQKTGCLLHRKTSNTKAQTTQPASSMVHIERRIGAEKPLGSRYLWQEAHSIVEKEVPMTLSITNQHTALVVMSCETQITEFIHVAVGQRKQLNQLSSWWNCVKRTSKRERAKKPTSESTQKFFNRMQWSTA